MKVSRQVASFEVLCRSRRRRPRCRGARSSSGRRPGPRPRRRSTRRGSAAATDRAGGSCRGILRDRFAAIVGQLAERRGELGHHRLPGAGAADRPRREVRDGVPELRHRQPAQRRDGRLRGRVAGEVDGRRHAAGAAARARPATVAGSGTDGVARARDARPPAVARPRRVPGARRTASRATRRWRRSPPYNRRRRGSARGMANGRASCRVRPPTPRKRSRVRARYASAADDGASRRDDYEKAAPFTPGAPGTGGVWRTARR